MPVQRISSPAPKSRRSLYLISVFKKKWRGRWRGALLAALNDAPGIAKNRHPPPDSKTFESGSHAGHNPRPLRFFYQFPLGGMPNNQPWKLPIYNDSNVADVSVTLYFCYGDGLKSMLPVLLPVLCQFYGNLIKTQHKTRTGIKIVESPKRYPARPLRCDP